MQVGEQRCDETVIRCRVSIGERLITAAPRDCRRLDLQPVERGRRHHLDFVHDYDTGVVGRVERLIGCVRRASLLFSDPSDVQPFAERDQVRVGPDYRRDGALDFTRLRNPKSVTKEARARFRNLGFDRLRFHDLRGSHGTALLDAGVPVHVVRLSSGMIRPSYSKSMPGARSSRISRLPM